MLKDEFIAANPYFLDSVDSKTAPYSNAIERSMYFKTSFHCPGRTLIIQVSNVLRPKENSEDDWCEPGGHSSGEDLVWTETPAKWMRVKGVEDGDCVFVNSVFMQR